MKKFGALLLSGVMFISSTPLNIHATTVSFEAEKKVAAAKVELTKEDEPTTEALEKAIKNVKSKIAIPSDYTQFDYYYNTGSVNSDSTWNLTWRNPSNGSSIYIRCNQKNNITYYTKYDYSNKESRIPAYLQKELKSKAEQFIKKIAPEVASKIEFVDSSYEGVHSGTYLYKFNRVENGIPFPDNTVSISVDSVTGEVKSAAISWVYDMTIPSASIKISKNDAMKALENSLAMELVYRTDYYSIYHRENNNNKKAFLVYQPKDSYISLDAKTGEVYKTRSQWVTRDEFYTGNSMAKEAADAANGASVSLTEEEIKKLDDLRNLISKDKAIKVVLDNQYLLIDKNLKSYNANLSKALDSKGNEVYYWNVELRDPRPIDYQKGTDFYRAYAYAQVDAKNGNIISYNASLKNYYEDSLQTGKNTAITFNKAKSQVILENFLKEQLNDRFKKSKLVEDYNDMIAYYNKENQPVYAGFSFEYHRVNEGVVFPYNNIRGSVDGVSGKIYNFNSYWDDTVVFESPKKAITPKEAFKHYISKDGFNLVYEINEVNILDNKVPTPDKNYNYSNGYAVERQVRLVYRPDIIPSFISPFTGEQLDGSGKVYKKTKLYTYADITDSSSNRDILLLSDMNIGFEGENFNPTKSLTLGELNILIEQIGFYYGRINTEDKISEQLVTREAAAVTFINLLGLEKISKLKGIYHTGYADESSIREENRGAVALAKGYGLITGDKSGNFNPKSYISRKDVVELILNYIRIQQSGLYN